jgi:hypothetical protein
MNLGLLQGTDLVGCLQCPTFRLLSFSTCAEHVHKHINNARDIPTREVKQILKKYNVFEELVCKNAIKILDQ